MQTVDFSKMLLNRSAINETAFFNTFEQRQTIKVNRIQIDWPGAWDRLLQFGLNPHVSCPDLSEIGTSWLGSFYTMEALHSFAGQEIAKIGGTKQFLSEAWQACAIDPQQSVVGTPWTLDIRIVLYRRDWLQKAGIEETTAFSNADYFRQTLHGLQEAGHPFPLGLTTRQTVTRMLHDLASWVWDARGEIRSNDGRKMLLAQPASLAGLEAYFGLNEFLDPEQQGQTEPEVLRSFLDGKTAVAIVSDRNYYLSKVSETSAATENLGVARLMKVPFLGGTALAIWRYSTHIDAALKLIEYLTSVEAGQVLYEQYLTTPANLEAVAQSTLAQDPFYPILRKSLLTGRSFHSGYRWAGIEARLIPVIEQFWQDLRANPKVDIAREVEKQFTELCTRLEQTILIAN
jgi:ABC-type glycerol-3-phosphate transport system substrate-binding protein